MLYIVAAIHCLVLLISDVSGQSIVNCPEDILVFVPYPSGGTSTRWIEPSPPSNDWMKTFQSHTPGTELRVGVTFVTYIYAHPRMAADLTCMFRVTVEQEDNEPPTIQGCPESPLLQEYEVGPGNAHAYWREPEATDNSGPVTLVERPYSPGEPIWIGDRRNFQMNYVFEDSFGNRAHCTFELRFIPVDTTPPRIKQCPYVVAVDVPLDSNGTIVSWDPPRVEDNSGDVTLHIDPEIMTNYFPVGLTILNYIYTDPSGNFNFCTINVLVNKRDITPPEPHCPSEMVFGARPGEENIYVYWDPATATDDSGIVITDCNHVPGVYAVVEFPLTVICFFRDPAGNEGQCFFLVGVMTDEEPPTIFGCPSEGIAAVVPAGARATNVTWVEPQARDDTVLEYPLQSHYPGQEFGVGNTTVDYVFEDSAGNVGVCSFVVMAAYKNNIDESGGNEAVVIVIIVCITVIIVIFAQLLALLACLRHRRRHKTPHATNLSSPSLPSGHVNESYTTLGHVPKRPLPSIRQPASGSSMPSSLSGGIPATPNPPTAEPGYIQPIAS